MFYIERTRSRDSNILRSKRLTGMEKSGTAKEGTHSIQHILQYMYKNANVWFSCSRTVLFIFNFKTVTTLIPVCTLSKQI